MILVFSHYLGLWVRSVHVFVVDEYWVLVHYFLTGIKYVRSLHIWKQAIVSAVCQGNWESKATLSQISPDFDEMWSRKEKRKQPRTRHPRGRRRYMHYILNSASWLKWFLDQLNKCSVVYACERRPRETSTQRKKPYRPRPTYFAAAQ